MQSMEKLIFLPKREWTNVNGTPKKREKNKSIYVCIGLIGIRSGKLANHFPKINCTATATMAHHDINGSRKTSKRVESTVWLVLIECHSFTVCMCTTYVWAVFLSFRFVFILVYHFMLSLQNILLIFGHKFAWKIVFYFDMFVLQHLLLFFPSPGAA